MYEVPSIPCPGSLVGCKFNAEGGKQRRPEATLYGQWV